IQPHMLEPWYRFRAGLIGLHPSPASLRYLKIVAAAIATLYRRDDLRWGIDQFLLYGAYEFLAGNNAAPKIKTLGEDAVDVGMEEYRGVAPFWFNTGRRKWETLERAVADPAAGGGIDTP